MVEYFYAVVAYSKRKLAQRTELGENLLAVTASRRLVNFTCSAHVRLYLLSISTVF
jgi:hypothetical protein